jgi:hypothetical protein
MDNGDRRRSVGPPTERHVDAGLDKHSSEQRPVIVSRKRAEIRHRDTEPTEGDCGVERPTAGYWPVHAVVVDEVD